MRALFYEVVREAKNAKVLIDGEEWCIAFNTIIYEDGKIKEEYFNDRNMSTLVIKDEERFIEVLKEYVYYCFVLKRKTLKFYNNEYDNKIKMLIAYLFINFSTEDFLNPVEAIRRYIDYMLDNSFEYLNEGKVIPLGSAFGNSDIFLKRTAQSVMMETPWKIDISLCKWVDDEMVSCPLADVSYGIREENGEKVCYVYSMMKPKEKGESSDREKIFRKRLNRELYKLNEGVLEQESEDFIKYRNGETRDYQENVTDVTQSFVLSLSIFVTLLQKEGISKIKVVPYLTVRYVGRQITAMNVTNLERQQELYDRNKRIQDNCTNKFMRTFRRVAYHMGDDLEMYSVPYEIDEYMTFVLKSKSHDLNNPILNEVSNCVLESEMNMSL
ncbi:MAG: hypothetical protein IKM55_00130 [Bacilli bacterium]|nr:hypothetical protein [Bacilli bacterium]